MKLSFKHLLILLAFLCVISLIISVVSNTVSSLNAKQLDNTTPIPTINLNDYSTKMDDEVSKIQKELTEDFNSVKSSYYSTGTDIIVEISVIDDELCDYAKKLYNLGDGEDETWQQMKYKLQDYIEEKYETLKSSIPIKEVDVKLFNSSSYEIYKDTDGEEDYNILNISNGDVITDIVFDGIPNTSNEEVKNENITVGMENAVKKAKSYISVSAFSRDGLIKQLEYNKFSHSEAVYGADNCGADWYQQAVKKAQSYLSVSSFSYEGLKDQLLYVGFTEDEASYGVSVAYK